MNKSSKWTFWVGVLIVIATHIYMLLAGLPQSQMAAHAVLNLVAAGLLLYSHMKR